MVYGDERARGVPEQALELTCILKTGVVTGKLFQLEIKDILNVPEYGEIELPLLIVNPVIFIRAEDLGIKGTELTNK